MQSRVETKLQWESNTKRQLGNQVVRIGAVSYLNSKPLIYGLSDSLGESGALSLAVPSQLAMELNSHSIDIGLIPVVEYFQIPEFRIVSDAAIACRGPVWSVRIFFRCDPSQVKTLALDEGSRTSAALSKVLFHERFGFVPKTIPLPMTADPMNVNADAVLVIGDRAMHPENFRASFCSEDYLTNYIRFFLRKDELAGLDEFRRRCLALGLISF